MNLSPIGKMAEKYWLEIPNHFPFVKLDVFVVMPNHIHGIIVIDKPNNEQNTDTVETQDFASLLKDKGRISALDAKLEAEQEYEEYRVIQDKNYISDFDREIKRITGKKK